MSILSSVLSVFHSPLGVHLAEAEHQSDVEPDIELAVKEPQPVARPSGLCVTCNSSRFKTTLKIKGRRLGVACRRCGTKHLIARCQAA